MLTNCNNLFNFTGTSGCNYDRKVIDDVVDTVDDMSENIPYTTKKNNT